MLRVALTGGIASGKSSAAEMFRELGVPVIDTDRVARDIVQPGQPALDALVSALGESILDETDGLDRKKLRERIFSDSTVREQVNALLHPRILDNVEHELAALHAPYAVVEIPLLAETGLAPAFDRVLVIDLPESLQRQRLQQRDGMSNASAKAALAAQAPRATRVGLATDVIDNTGTLENLRSAVAELHEKYLQAARQFASARGAPSE